MSPSPAPATSRTEVPTSEKVLVVGAGPAGLAAAASLRALDVPFDLVDRAADVGGIWDLEAETPAWPGMRAISSTEMTQFEDLLMPASFPAFPDAEQMAKYLRAYAARYHLTDHFLPGVAVRSARPFDAEGVWQVELSDGRITTYRALVAAHGISAREHRPDWAQREGLPASLRIIHSRTWPGAEAVEGGLQGRKVLVVGSGQSAADIAVDAASRALEVRWSVRTGHWVVPRHIGSVPGDVAASREPAVLGALNEKVAEAVIARTVGTPQKHGLPAPRTPLLEDRVIVSDDLLPRIDEGRITPVADVRSLDAEGRAHLVDGATWAPDLIILATGYEDGADYLDPELVPRTPQGAPDLFLGAFPRTRDDLVLLGQFRTAGGILPLLAQQADIAAYFLRAVREQRPEAEAFRRLRTGADAAVPTRLPARGASDRATEGGIPAALGGALSRRVERLQAMARRSAGTQPASEPGQLPFVDRADLLGRLRTVRALFEAADSRS